MRAVVTVMGKDRSGIIAKISGVLYEYNVNVLDIRQNVMEDIFAMTMLVDLTKCSVELSQLSKIMEETGNDIAVKVIIMHEDVFNAMHRV
jgi:ACT domain-containing protein